RTVLVDRADVVDQHRTATAFVVAHHDVPFRQERRREQQPRVDVGERVRLVGADVYELRRGAARGALAARNIGALFPGDRRLHARQPRGEFTGGNRGHVPTVGPESSIDSGRNGNALDALDSKV